MHLKVNGEVVDITLENEKTIGDVLASFEKEAAKNEATTTKIILNGKEIPANNFESILNTPIEENTELDLSVISKLAITDSFESCSKELDKLNNNLKDISMLIQSGKDFEAVSIIKDLAEQVGILCKTITMSRLFPDIYNKIQIEGNSIESFFSEFTPILKNFEDALQNNDSVTVGDLSEYEISPRLEQLSLALQQFRQ